LRGVFFNAFKKPLHQVTFRLAGFAERPDAETIAIAQCAGNGDHAMQVKLQEIAAGRLAPAFEGKPRNFGVADFRPMTMQLAQSGYIGNRFDIEYENGCHQYDAGNGRARARIINGVRIPEMAAHPPALVLDSGHQAQWDRDDHAVQQASCIVRSQH
jgi:hypothetical protein